MNHPPLVVSPEAERDTLEASRWYEDRAKGLGVHFWRSSTRPKPRSSRTLGGFP